MPPKEPPFATNTVRPVAAAASSNSRRATERVQPYSQTRLGGRIPGPPQIPGDNAKLIENERWKYLATFLNTIAAAAIVVGIFTPMSGILAKGLHDAPDVNLLTVGGFVLIWIGVGVALHCVASFVLGNLRS